MGWCHEFGPQIREGCDHPMSAGQRECHCLVCGTRCEGRFQACSEVWGRGAAPAFVAPPAPRVAPPPEVDPAPAPGPTAGVPAAAVPSPATNEVLRAVCSALETVGAELRAMRAALDQGHDPPDGVQSIRAMERMTEMLDRLPDQVQSAVRGALHSAPAATSSPPMSPRAVGGE
jgi:hypothetical protein